jgi:hypothetical protein
MGGRFLVAGFLYHLPSVTRSIPHSSFAEYGIGHAFDKTKRPTVVDVTNGPGGSGGIVLADERHIEAVKIGYYPDKQTWRQVPRSEAWVGFYADDRPIPKDCARDQMLNGHPVRLGDDNLWIVPVARRFSDENGELCQRVALPVGNDLNASGEWVMNGILPRYQRLWDIAVAWFDAFHLGLEESSEVLALSWVLDSASEVLASNYRIGRAECAALGLMNGQSSMAILDAVADVPTLKLLSEKKTASDGLSS